MSRHAEKVQTGRMLVFRNQDPLPGLQTGQGWPEGKRGVTGEKEEVPVPAELPARTFPRPKRPAKTTQEPAAARGLTAVRGNKTGVSSIPAINYLSCY